MIERYPHTLIKIPTFFHHISAGARVLRLPTPAKLALFVTCGLCAVQGISVINFSIAAFCLACLWALGVITARKRLFVGLACWLAFVAMCFLFTGQKEVATDFLITLPWGRFVTEQTIETTIKAVGRWASSITSGLLFLSITTEKELILFFMRWERTRRVGLLLGIAISTFAITLSDVSKVHEALRSRGKIGTRLSGALTRFRIVGANLLLSQLNRVEVLKCAVFLRHTHPEGD